MFERRRGCAGRQQNLELQSRGTKIPILPCCISLANKVAGIVKKSRGDDKGIKMK